MAYKLPALPYSYDALEPYIDAKTMEIHYTKHHQGYIDKVNAALEGHSNLQHQTVDVLLADLNRIPESIRTTIRNNGGGHYNHAFFWPLMKKNGGGEPKGHIGAAIKQFFGDFATFQEQFNTAAKGVFGSGWAWLVIDKQNILKIISTPNQDCPISQGFKPIMGLDVWEHAYYLLYQNRRPDYINAWWHVLNWQHIEDNYNTMLE
ncbi:MAG TPA: superoxide dismutase [Candidatus Babeliales bacterium]|jgi:Fe-Mn family superoxide dismutase|nr:superoxide dismutase [Candidatus Babeliales bacterium]